MKFGKDALGNVFISHSSVDKAKVRAIDRRLRAHGYGTWLDEREMEVGDALAAKISEGVKDAKVVLVVVSAASLKSNWLRYELDIATDRMIAGHCRVIPVLIDEVSVPSELEGRLYADMRPGRRGGFNKIRKALEAEAGKYPEPATAPTMDSSQSWLRNQAYRDFLGDLGEGWYRGSIDVSAIRSVDVEGVTIGTKDVQVNFVNAYGFSEGQLTVNDFQDFESFVTEEAMVSLGMLISERPISAELSEALAVSDRVGVRHHTPAYGPNETLVAVDLSEDLVAAHAEDILTRAFELLAQAVDE